MKFSERMGFKPVADVIQVDGMSDALMGTVLRGMLDKKTAPGK